MSSPTLSHSRSFSRLIRGVYACACVTWLVLGPAGAGAAEEPPPVPVPAAPGQVVDDATVDRLLELHHTEEQEVRLVLLPAVVTDARGRIVQGLKAENFKLFEDYVPQEVRYFNTESTEPISIAFLLDISGSMRQVGKLDEAKQSIQIFVDALRPGDRFGLICFADDQVAWITEFTSDRERFLQRLGVQTAYGQTALFDAVAATPTLVDETIEGRKAIVLITDGNDNASRLNTFKAVQLARRVSVPIYTIGFASLADGVLPKGQTENSLVVLKRFATETGGHMFVVRDPDDLKEAVLRIQSEMRFQYVIGYHPTRTLWDGTFRKIKLETDRSRLTVRTRSGYYANP